VCNMDSPKSVNSDGDNKDNGAENAEEEKKKEEAAKKQQQDKQRKKDSAIIKAGGNFQVQVHLIEGRELTGKDAGGTSDPVVTVTIFGQKKSTKIISKTKNPRWDQVLYFELNNLEPDELTQGKALIQVFDADIISRNDLIGAFEFDLPWVYYREHHEAYNQWIALTNPEQNDEEEDEEEEEEKEKEGIDGIEGYLKCSITILGPNDEQFIHDEEAEAAKELDLESGMILMSPGIIQTPHMLTIKIYEARALTKTDKDMLFSKNKGDQNLDPFFTVEFAGTRLKSDVYKSVNPKCQVQFDIPVMEPVFSKNITISVKDYDKFFSDDRIASLKLDYLKLKQEYRMCMEPCWLYLYGAPQGHQSGYSKKMNKGLVEGSNFRGMVFMEASVKKLEKKGRKKVREKINALQDHEMPKMVPYCLRADVYEGTEIPKIPGGKKMFVGIEVCDCKAQSSVKEVGDKLATLKWYEALVSDGNKEKAIGPFYLPAGWEANPEPVILPDVFIYLCVKERGGDIEEVSYHRVPLSKIIPPPSKKGTFEPGAARKWDNEPRWFDMKENLALDKYEDNVFPGALLIGLNCGPVADLRDDDNKLARPPALARPFSNRGLFKELPTDKTPGTSPKGSDEDEEAKSPEAGSAMASPPPPTQSRTHADITFELVEAEKLPAMDGGLFTKKPSSDPYVEIVIQDRDGKKREKEIEKVEKTLDPKWRTKLVFNNVRIGSTMYLRVMDWDAGPDPDDEMGHLAAFTLNGVDKEADWMELTPSKEAEKKYKKKRDKLKDMKIKMGIKYDWDVEPVETKKKGGLFSKLKPKAAKAAQTVDKITEPQRRVMQLRAHIFQAKNLENSDAFGLSDGYLVVRFCGMTAKTKVKEDQIDPKWYQTLTFSADVPTPLKYAPRIYCEVFDHDDIGKDETLGRFEVEPEDCWTVFQDENADKIADRYQKSATAGPEPRWYQLKNAEHETVKGSVLCAFELIGITQSNIAIPSIRPKFERKRWINIHTLGLREIQSTFGCFNPFIEFEMNGTIYETEKSNRPNSRNPNFCQILKFEVKLPNKDIFLPNLNLTIKDSLFGGLIKRKLGFASLEIADLMNAENAEMFKITKEEREARAMRAEAAATKAELDAKEEENKDEEEHDDSDQKEAVVVKFSSESEKDTENTPLIKKQMTSANVVNEELRLQRLREAKEQGRFASYEWTKRTTYDLSKVQPDYMKDRGIHDDELEDQMPLRPFLKIPFIFGKNERTVGYFKGLISFHEHKKVDKKENGNFKYLQEITNPTGLYLRLYVLQGHKLVPADSGGSSDPYLIVKTGKTKISTRDSYLANTLEPGFYQAFEIPVTMPGDSKLTIEVWDWDGIGDDMIGRTEIDIEDRWYSKDWREMPIKPLETRTLWSEQSTVSQGKLSLWMEFISPADAKKYPMVDISPPDQLEYELRVIVWQCKDCPIMDEMTNMNDLYITGELSSSVEDECSTQQTDLHFRSQNGCGSFNWRMKFPLKLPKRKLAEYPRFNIQIWDKDFFSPNDNIAEAIIDLQPFLRYAEKFSAEKRCVLEYDEQDKFWVDLAQKGGGKVQLSFELLPKRVSEQLPAGFGREAPNANPHLPEPEGRAKFSLLNPCQSLRNLLGDRLCCKLVLICLCVVCLALAIFITPNLISAVTANVITGA